MVAVDVLRDLAVVVSSIEQVTRMVAADLLSVRRDLLLTTLSSDIYLFRLCHV